MKIRTALVLACFLLSVVPLGGIVIYSYFASRRALESVYHAEAARLTGQMDRRLGSIRDDLQQRLAEVSALPDLPNAEREKEPVVGNILMTMGDAASLFDSLEIQPIVRHVAKAVEQHVAVAAAAPPLPPPAPNEPIVIDIPPMAMLPRFSFGEEQRAHLKKITELSRELGSELSPERRQELQQQLKAAQSAFSEEMKVKGKQFDQQLKERLNAQKDQRESAAAMVEVHRRHELSEAEKERIKTHAKQEGLLFGKRFNVPLTREGTVVGRLQGHVSTDEVVRRILGASNEDRSEITFAVDREGNVYTRSADDRRVLDRVGIPQRIASGKPLNDIRNWIVVLRRDPQSGLRVGVARPFGEDLEGLRKTAATNFGYGIALIFVALLGIVPIANHITRDVEVVTRGAERVAQGDLSTRLPVRSKNEFGQLAAAFNRMAEDINLQQQRIVAQERAAIEYERKSVELEEARRFQLSMLPKQVPRHPRYDIAVFTHTAAEVGGDYYDFHVGDGDAVSVTIGDATGHGARAGTMVAVIKALFAGYDGQQKPAQFLREATEKVRRMDLERMAMALLLARFEDGQVTIASAGMPPAYVHRRAAGSVEEIAIGATPLGTLGSEYNDVAVQLAEGDTILFMSDGFPELMNAAGQQLGYAAAAEAFGVAAEAEDSNGVIASLAEAVQRWHGEQLPNDDVTFVVVKMGVRSDPH